METVNVPKSKLWKFRDGWLKAAEKWEKRAATYKLVGNLEQESVCLRKAKECRQQAVAVMGEE